MGMNSVLHPIEAEIIGTLKKKNNLTINEITSETKLSLDQVRRGIEWLKKKELIELEEKKYIFVELDTLGIKSINEGLPERRILNLLAEKGGKEEIGKVKKELGMEEKEFSAAIGFAIKSGCIEVTKEKEGVFVKLLSLKLLDSEALLKKIYTKKQIEIGELTFHEKRVLDELKKRPNYIKFREVSEITIKAKENAFTLFEEYSRTPYVEKLTPELIISGKWKEVKFRPYDVEGEVPTVYPGRKHPVQDFIDQVREIFLSFGFEEIEGPVVLPSFWNFDALFIPQDHPAREMQDTFYLKGIFDERIEKNPIIGVIKSIHEKGGDTGSRGWNYKWSVEEAKKTVLRTHTTPITLQYLYKNKPSSAKVFSIDKVFRNENLDSKHLFEFHQYEGIVTGKNVTLRHLIGILSSFYKELGFKKIKFWPTYFPYTEPSLEAVAYVEKIGKWLELCGMGVFRPEVVLPAGIKNPVLAWGGGLERLILLAYEIDDIRFLYENHLSWLRGVNYARTKL
ncbi:MAG: phenylalanine--tRNA ligase subunit alpha [Nitrososphaeria archaeon]